MGLWLGPGLTYSGDVSERTCGLLLVQKPRKDRAAREEADPWSSLQRADRETQQKISTYAGEFKLENKYADHQKRYPSELHRISQI